MTELCEQLLSFVDTPLAAVTGGVVRICIWGLLGGVLSMLIYRWSSPQDKLKELGTQAADARRALNAHTGNFSDAMVLMRTSCSLSLQRLKVAVIPSVLAGLPVLILLVGLQPRFADVSWIESGPEWVRSWLTLFMGATCVSALATKFALKIR